MSKWNHTICERCWFARESERFPVQIRRESEDRFVDTCCFCGTVKITRIWVRESPDSPSLLCAGSHEDDDD